MRSIQRSVWTIPNVLGVGRIALVPILWALALLGHRWAVGVGVLVAGLTDALDGPISRYQGLADEAGAKLDSLGDNLLAPSMLAWLVMFEPALLGHSVSLSVWLALFCASMAVGWLKFRRFGGLHLWSSKVAGLVQYLFVIHTLLAGKYSPPFYYLAVGSGIASSAETLVLQLTSHHVDSRRGSIFRSGA